MEEKDLLLQRIEELKSLMREIGSHPETKRLILENLEKQMEGIKIDETSREEYLRKTQKMKELLQEMGRHPEVRKLAEEHISEIQPQVWEELKTPCTGCGTCAPCIFTPTPDFEAILTVLFFHKP